MVTGSDSFKEWFKGSEEQYAIRCLQDAVLTLLPMEGLFWMRPV